MQNIFVTRLDLNNHVRVKCVGQPTDGGKARDKCGARPFAVFQTPDGVDADTGQRLKLLARHVWLGVDPQPLNAFTERLIGIGSGDRGLKSSGHQALPVRLDQRECRRGR